jgi:hypothetical protein
MCCQRGKHRGICRLPLKYLANYLVLAGSKIVGVHALGEKETFAGTVRPPHVEHHALLLNPSTYVLQIVSLSKFLRQSGSRMQEFPTA